MTNDKPDKLEETPLMRIKAFVHWQKLRTDKYYTEDDKFMAEDLDALVKLVEAQQTSLPSKQEFKEWYFKLVGQPVPDGNFHCMAEMAYDWLKANTKPKPPVSDESLHEDAEDNAYRFSMYRPSVDSSTHYRAYQAGAYSIGYKDGWRSAEKHHGVGDL